MNRLIALLIPALLLSANGLVAEVRLASPFTAHMVLQRDLRVPVWGHAAPAEQVTIEFAGQTTSTAADASGNWRVELAPLQASAEPRTFTAKGSKTAAPLVLNDVLVGEVWLASGQSNMVFTLSKSRYAWAGVINESKEIAEANHPAIRMFTGAEQKAYTPQTTIGGEWQVCTPANAPAFSAIAYYFARHLEQELKVPVGILSLSYGASTSHAWIRREAMLEDARFKAVLDRFDEQVKTHVPPTPAELEDWQRAAELAKAEKRRAPPKPGRDPVQDQHNPTVMYNGMIAPVIPYAIRGVIWYQGESVTNPRELFPAWNALLISDWRKLWSRDLPFYFCQLASLANNSNSPEVRAWQAEALKIPGTGMAVTIDVGDEKDVHPHDKAPVGKRLALLALARTYGQAVPCSGPVLRSVTRDGATLRLAFEHTEGGLSAKNGPLQTFEIAGEDGNYVAADASVDGDSVVVSSKSIPMPQKVRYAWSNYPATANLVNGAGLPAAPIQSAVTP